MVVGFLVLLVHLVAQPSGQKGEELADVSRVGVDEGVGSEHAELAIDRPTAKPAAGKATKLLEDCSRVME